jgi:nitroreductase
VPTEDIVKMVEAARLAPSGKNIQNWHYIVIKDGGLIRQVGEAVARERDEIAAALGKSDAERAGRFRKFVTNFTLFFTKAPALIVVMSERYAPSGYYELLATGRDPEWLVHEKNPGMQSLGASIEHLLLKAAELGYGACWLTSANYADKRIEALMKEAAGFDKPGYFMAALISLGVTDGVPKSPPRKGLEDIMTVIE